MKPRSSALLALALACGTLLAPPRARAEDEAPDPTRLDVERLPPEALQLTRDMYAQGFYVTAKLGGQGIAGGAGRLSLPGPLARVGFGYELTPWFSFGAIVALSFHATDAPPPPAPSAFQLYHLLGEARAQLPLSVRSALWLAGQLGVGWASGDFLQAWGLRKAGDVSAAFGGELGFDYHLMNAHHSLGVATGALMQPSLDRDDGDTAIVLHGTAYLKYVF